MKKKKRPPKRKSLTTSVVRVSKREAEYVKRLKVVRQVLGGFDAKRLDTLARARPTSDAGRSAKRRDLARIRRAYAAVRPFVFRPHKVVKPKDKENFEELRKYVGIPKFKNLRAIPVQTEAPKKLKVSFDRKHRPIIKVGKHYTEKFFRFPHMPQGVDDAIAMFEEMRGSMPDGIYVLASRHHFLIPTAVRKSLIEDKLREFYTKYGSKAPELVRLLFGFKWLARGTETADRRLKELETERGRVKQMKRDAKLQRVITALADMQKFFRGSRAAQVVGAASPKEQGQPWRGHWSLATTKKIISDHERAKRRKVSKRERAKGRR